MRSLVVKTIALSAGLALSVGTANAAIISGTYTVIGSNFTSNVVSPFASITESFTISFDNTVTTLQQTTGISLNASTITPTSTLAFRYIAGADQLTVGGIASGVGVSDPGSTDFALTISNASSVANFGITSLTYTNGTNSIFTALTRTKPAAVPEPASLALLGIAAVMFAFVRRRRTS